MFTEELKRKIMQAADSGDVDFFVELSEKLASKSDDRNGWLTPSGKFLECPETPAVRMGELELGEHAKFALFYCQRHEPAMHNEMYRRRAEAGLMTWEERGGEKIIHDVMKRNGYKRLAAE